jgi:putative nucleotidyltransferase with HDIG domain
MSETISHPERGGSIRAYASILACTALGIAVPAAVIAGLGRWDVVALLGAVGYVAESRTIRISTRVELSGSLIPLVMAAVLFGPAAAAVVGLASMLSDRRGPLERFAIFSGGRALAGACAGLGAAAVTAFDGSAGVGHLFAAAMAAAIPATVVEFLVTAITLWLRHRTSPVDLWRLARVHDLVCVAVCAPVACLFAHAYLASGVWVLAFFVIPVAASHLAFGMHAPKEQLIAALEQTNAELEAANSHLRRINMSFAEALVKAIDGRDAYTAGHSKAVAEYSRDIARELGLSREEVARIHLCGLVHDIGKIGVRAEVLEKQAALDDGEWDEMRRHSAIGEAILLEVPGYSDMAEVVRSHHERWDGRGYPDNLRGEDIPLLARVIAVADSYNAMTSDRPYRDAMPSRVARLRLAQAVGTQFDTTVVAAFEAVLASASEAYRTASSPDFSVFQTDAARDERKERVDDMLADLHSLAVSPAF